MLDSYENYNLMKRRARTEPRMEPCSGVSASKLSAGITHTKLSKWGRLNRPYMIGLVL